jgi:hypothetical protein
MSDDLWNQLRVAAIVEGEAPAQIAHSPWYLRLMLGAAAWIAAGLLAFAFFLAFAFLFDLFDKGYAFFFITLVGFFLCAGATCYFRYARTNDFTRQFAFATSLVGTALIQCICLYWNLTWSDGIVFFTLALTLAVLFFAIPDPAHRVWAASAGICALCVWVFQEAPPQARDFAIHALASASSLALPGFWLPEFRRLRALSLWRPAAYGVTVAFLLLNIGTFLDPSLLLLSSSVHRLPDASLPNISRMLWIGMNGIALLWTAWMYFRDIPAGNSRCAWVLVALMGILALAHIKLVFLGPCLILILIGRGQGNRILTGAGILSLLFCLGLFYYALEITLLQKSLAMMAGGGALLLARYLLLRLWSRDHEETPHA